MAARNVAAQVLFDFQLPRGFRAGIGGHGHKVKFTGNVHGPNHIGVEHHHALQNAHKQGIFAGIFLGQGLAQLRNAGVDLIFGQQNAFNVLVHGVNLFL